MKLVMIGAGSTVFTPGLIADLTGSTRLSDMTIALVDINSWAAETMARYAERVAAERGARLRVEFASDRRQVLAGADFVTVTIAVGGARAWERDVRIPEAHGVYQTVGDSVGPGESSAPCGTSRSSSPSPGTWKSSVQAPGSSTTPIH